MFCACWGCKTICWACPGGTGGSRIFCNGLWVLVEVFKLVDCTVLEATKLGRLGLVGVEIWDMGACKGWKAKTVEVQGAEDRDLDFDSQEGRSEEIQNHQRFLSTSGQVMEKLS